MLIPQFTIRWILGATAVCAVAALIVSLALGDVAWAQGVSVALVALILVVVVQMLFFAVIQALGLIVQRGRPRTPLGAEPSAWSAVDLTPTSAIVIEPETSP